MRELLEWIDRKNPKLNDREAVKLLRRVFEEQFEMVEGKLQPTQRGGPARYRTRMIPMLITPIRGPRQWIGYKVHVAESVDPEQPIKKKGEPAEHFITEILTTEAAQDEMAGLTETLRREQVAPWDNTPGDVYGCGLRDRAYLDAS